MADTERLRDMLDNIIDDKGEEAQVDFHAYLQDKIKDVLGGNQENAEADAPAKETNED